MISFFIFLIVLGTVAVYFIARRIAIGYMIRHVPLKSLPQYYGYYAALWVFFASLAFLLVGLLFRTSMLQFALLTHIPPDLLTQYSLSSIMGDVHALAMALRLGHSIHDVFLHIPALDSILPLAVVYNTFYNLYMITLGIFIFSTLLLVTFFLYRYLNPARRVQHSVDTFITISLQFASWVAVFTTIAIVFSLLFETLQFFHKVSIFSFFLDTRWSMQGFDSQNRFGVLPLLVGTLLISFIAVVIAVVLGLFAALTMSEYLRPSHRRLIKPLLEVLAGVPTIVYGFFAVMTISPLITTIGNAFNYPVSPESALAAALVMGIMLVPFISSLTDDVLRSLPNSLREGALALGATKGEMILRVLMPAALPGIMSGILLTISRAIGETMIVVMASGLMAHLSLNPLDSVTTITTQIVMLLQGDQEFSSAKTLAAFALGFVLFSITFALNLFAIFISRRYQRHYL